MIEEALVFPDVVDPGSRKIGRVSEGDEEFVYRVSAKYHAVWCVC
jgi:hypothetical protein